MFLQTTWLAAKGAQTQANVALISALTTQLNDLNTLQKLNPNNTALQSQIESIEFLIQQFLGTLGNISMTLRENVF